MALWITIDRLDGTTTVKGPVEPDEIDTFGMLMTLNRGNIAGITFTRANPLQKLQQLTNKESLNNRLERVEKEIREDQLRQQKEKEVRG